MNDRLSLFSILVAATGLIAACGPLDGPTSPTETAGESAALAGPGILPMCQEGCLDVDPAPDSAGIFIGQTSASQCTAGTDADADGLADFCETRLSNAFAPELRYWSPDEVGRESKWVARWLDGETVRIGYLLS